MSKAAEHKWAGELAGMAFILEITLAQNYLRNGGKLGAQLDQREILRQWGNGSLARPHGMSAFDASLIHQAGRARIESIFDAVIDRLAQTEA